MAQNDNKLVENTAGAAEGNSHLVNLYVSLYSGLRSDNTLAFFVILNLIFTVMRFHDFSGMGFLGMIRLPALISIICIVLVIPKLSMRWLPQMKIMLGLILFELVRGVVGYLIIPDLVLNDGWHMHILGDICLNVFSMAFPIVLIFNNGFRLRKLLSFFLIAGFLLGIWSITHGGKGPGGYLGDENDNCLVLVYLLPIPFFLFSQSKNILFKLACIISGLIVILGAVFTNSRGGFIGLVMVILMQFLLSRSKIKWVLSAVFLGLVSLPIIPAKYWEEIYSIKTESGNKTGTMQERIDTWKSTTRMWLDPRNILFGTGLENGKWNVSSYEDEEAGYSKRSIAGREAHSLYFQILGDLGVWGILVFGGIILLSIKQLRIVRREARRAYSLLNTESMHNMLGSLNNIISPLSKEILFLDGLSSTILCSWLGALSAAIGISVGYYPTIWLLSGISMAIYLYWTLIRDNLLSKLFENRMENYSA